jgi:outer membrane immunogenic protein
MKKLVLALTAVAAFTGSALAADLPARTYTKAPIVVPPAPTWTGCYIGVGGGGGTYTDKDSFLKTVPAGVAATTSTTQGGSGWLGTVQAGCDYQFAGTNWVIGGFADGDWTNIKGTHTGDVPATIGLNTQGNLTINNQFAVGGRVGYLVFPSLLTYVTAGYTQASMSGVTYTNLTGGLTGDSIGRQTYSGWFIGTGDEYSLANWLPGLFWKTEYRFSDFNTKDVPVVFNGTGVSNGFLEHTHFYENLVRTSLVYRFNWGGPVVAKY